VHQLTMLCAPTPAQWAGVAALEDGFADDFADTRYMIDEYESRRRYIIDAFNAMGLDCNSRRRVLRVPVDSVDGTDQRAVLRRTACEQKSRDRSGSAFGAGGEGHIRCCYATSKEHIEQAMQRVDAYLREIR
jgi:aminotransferase